MGGRRMGLLGGTFDPIHLGHIRAAQEVRRRFRLDVVLFIPSHLPPHKGHRKVVSAKHRLRMARLACRGRRGLAVSPVEIKAGGTSYSIITLKKVHRLHPGTRFFFILGVDAFLEIHTWRDYRKLLEQCSFIVISRPGYDLDRARGVLGGKLKERMVDLGLKRRVAEEKVLPTQPQIFLFPIRALNISSSEIRRRARNQESLRGLVPSGVEKYIRRYRLYQGGQ